MKIPVLEDFLTAIPTAELEPITETYVQSDEADMGMTYDELTTFGRLRKNNKLGPYGMFQRLVHEWGPQAPRAKDDPTPVYTPKQVADKVKRVSLILSSCLFPPHFRSDSCLFGKHVMPKTATNCLVLPFLCD